MDLNPKSETTSYPAVSLVDGATTVSRVEANSKELPLHMDDGVDFFLVVAHSIVGPLKLYATASKQTRGIAIDLCERTVRPVNVVEGEDQVSFGARSFARVETSCALDDDELADHLHVFVFPHEAPDQGALLRQRMRQKGFPSSSLELVRRCSELIWAASNQPDFGAAPFLEELVRVNQAAVMFLELYRAQPGVAESLPKIADRELTLSALELIRTDPELAPELWPEPEGPDFK